MSRLARMVASVRHRASTRAWRIRARLPDEECRARLERLLVVPEGSPQSGLDRLRHGPRHPTIDGLVEALARLVELRSLGVDGLEVAGVPTGRVEALAREANSAWAATIGRRRPERRIATLVAFARVMLASAHDDVCELFDVVVGQLLARVERAGQRQRLAGLVDFDAAALVLREVSLVVLDAAVADAELRKAVFERVSRPGLEAAAQVISLMAQAPGDRHYNDLLSRYPHVRRFLPLLLAHVGFEGSESAGAVLAAWRFLVRAETGLHSDFAEAPVDMVSRAWKPLRQTVAALMPKVDLPEVLLKVAAWTGFDTEFTHVSESGPRVGDLRTSICAVLLAEACNLGLEPVCRADRPALSRGRLAWVAQNYLRADTLTRVNCRLVDYQAGIPLARRFGGGEVASADGLRFVVPVHSVHAGPNRRYFGAGRGVTYYNFSSDQFTGFHAIVIPGTPRDSLFILDGLLDNPTSLEPTEVVAGTVGYS